MIQRKKDEWELGREISPDKLIEPNVVKYNNLVQQNLWNLGKSKDTKGVALTTNSEELQQYFTTSSANSYSYVPKKTLSFTIISSRKGKSLNIPDWGNTNKGPTIVIEGRKWYCCKHHVFARVYDDLYMNRKSEDHEDQVAKKGRKIKPDNETDPFSDSDLAAKKLTLSD